MGIRSRARRNCTRSYRGGQPPRKLPTRGTHPPRSPCSNPTLKAFILSHTLAPYASRLTFHVFSWRRGWDSNPRSHCWDACFPSMSIRPLSHLSAPILRGGILTRGLATSKVTASALCHGIAPRRCFACSAKTSGKMACCIRTRFDSASAFLWPNSLLNRNSATTIHRTACIAHIYQTLPLYVLSMKWAHPCRRHCSCFIKDPICVLVDLMAHRLN